MTTDEIARTLYPQLLRNMNEKENTTLRTNIKRTVIFVLVLMMLLPTQTAFAAGKLSVTQENFWVVNDYRTYAYGYARIENVGDRPIKVHAGLLEVFDENGDTITSSDSLNAYARYLQPGEYTYAYVYSQIEDNDPPFVVDDYLLTITGKNEYEKYSLRLPCETDYVEDVNIGYYTYDYMYATITNDTDEPLYGIQVIFALLDDDGNILYMDNDYLHSNIALMPGSSAIIRKAVDEDNKEVFSSQGFTATHVDAIAYVDREVEG